MKIYNSSKVFNYLANIFKYAFEDIPDWYADLQRETLRKTKSIEKHPLLKNFREMLSDDEMEEIGDAAALPYERDFIDDLMTNFNILRIYMIRYLSNEQFYTKYAAIKEFLQSPFGKKLKAIREGKIAVGKNSYKIGKIYRAAKAELDAHNAGIYVKEFDELAGKKDWDKRIVGKKNNWFVVFSTNYRDIAEMSSRSDWSSCQDISPRGMHRSGYAKGVIGACLSKYVGIVYLTNGQDYEGRGEKMLYRSTVFLLTDEAREKYMTFMPRIFPRDNDIVANIFEKYLAKNLGIDSLYSDDKTPSEFGMIAETLDNPPYEDVSLKKWYSKEYIIDKIKSGDGNWIQKANPEWPEYKDLVIAAIKTNTRYIAHAKKEWPEYKDLVIDVINRGGDISFARKEWEEYPKLLNTYLMRYPSAIFHYLESEDFDLVINFPNFRTIFSSALSGNERDMELIKRIPKNIPNYVELMMPVLEKNVVTSGVFEYVTENVDKNSDEYKKLVIEVVKGRGSYLKYADYKWEEYGDIVIEAVNGIHGSYCNCIYINPNWDGFYNFMENAINNYPYSISYVSKDYPRYNELAIIAAKKDTDYIKFVDPTCKEYKEIVMNAAKISPYVVKYANPEWPEYMEMAKQVIMVSQGFCSDCFDKKFAGYDYIQKLASIARQPSKLRQIPVDDLNYYEYARMAIAGSESMEYVDPTCKRYDELLKEAVQKFPFILSTISFTYPEYFELAKLAIDQMGYMYLIRNIPANYPRHDEFLEYAYSKYGKTIFKHINPDYPRREEFIAAHQ